MSRGFGFLSFVDQQIANGVQGWHTGEGVDTAAIAAAVAAAVAGAGRGVIARRQHMLDGNVLDVKPSMLQGRAQVLASSRIRSSGSKRSRRSRSRSSSSRSRNSSRYVLVCSHTA
jgi:hypothetical protein